jgi:hypothetical protein
MGKFYVESLELYAIWAVGVVMEPMLAGRMAEGDLWIATEKVTTDNIDSMATHRWPDCLPNGLFFDVNS